MNIDQFHLIHSDLITEASELRYLADAADTMGNDRLAQSLHQRANNVERAATQMFNLLDESVNELAAEGRNHWNRVGDALMGRGNQ
jgi:hypothetical protein